MPNGHWKKAALLTVAIASMALPGFAGPGEAGGPIAVGDGPVAVAVDSSAQRMYVANRTAGTVTQVSVDPNFVVPPRTTIPVGAQPSALAVNSGTGKVYVANQGSNTVSVIDNGAVVAAIAVGIEPAGVAVDPDVSADPGLQSRIYVTNAGNRTISVIDGQTDTVVATVNTISKYPSGIGVDTTQHRVYVAARDSNVVVVMNGATNVIEDFLGVGHMPTAVAVDSTFGRAYIANTGSDSITIIDTVNNAIIRTATVPVPPDPAGATASPSGLAIDPDTSPATGAQSILYISTQPNAVWAYDVAADDVIDHNPFNNATGGGDDPMRVGMGPAGMGFDPATKLAYVANTADDTVSPIGLDTVAPGGTFLTPAGSILVGTGPAPIPGAGLNQIFGTATDDLSGIRFVHARFNTTTGPPTVGSINPGVGCRTCTWSVIIPASAVGNTFVNVTIIDRGGNTHELPPLEIVIV